MHHEQQVDQFKSIGESLISGADTPVSTPLPITVWRDFDLRFTVEYPAVHYAAEVGFWASIMGLQFLSLDSTYAICTDQAHSFTFSFKPADHANDLGLLRIQWFTDGLERVAASLSDRKATFEIVPHSDHQRFIRLHSPSGMPVEVWSGWEEAEE